MVFYSTNPEGKGDGYVAINQFFRYKSESSEVITNVVQKPKNSMPRNFRTRIKIAQRNL
jgi:hypothetical protein